MIGRQAEFTLSVLNRQMLALGRSDRVNEAQHVFEPTACENTVTNLEILQHHITLRSAHAGISDETARIGPRERLQQRTSDTSTVEIVDHESASGKRLLDE